MPKIKLDIETCRRCYLASRYECESIANSNHVTDCFETGEAPCVPPFHRPSIYRRPKKACLHKFEHAVAAAMTPREVA